MKKDRPDSDGLSRLLRDFREAELRKEEIPSVWPAVRSVIAGDSVPAKSLFRRKRILRISRPIWWGAAAAAVLVLLIVVAPAVFSPPKLPANYCRIDRISSPEHQLMIYQGKEDGFTIIWLME